MANVLVYGGTGSQACPTVMHLLERGHSPVVVSRNISGADDLAAAGALVVEGDLADADQLVKITQNVDMVAFLLPAFLGDGDDAAQFGINAIDAAVASGVRRFVWNASGPIPDDVSDPKKRILDHLEKSGLDWVVFEPTTYMENWLGPWTAPFVKADDEVAYPVLEDVKIGWLACDDVGKLVVAALENEQVVNKRFDISGVEAPVGSELAYCFSRALDRNITYRAMTPEQMGACIDQAFGPGSGDRIAQMYRAEQQDQNPEPKFHDMNAVTKLLGIEMTTIEAWVRDQRSAFE